jgi:hypothetical protein
MYAGNEIRSVIMHGDRFSKYPIGKIDGTYTWQVMYMPCANIHSCALANAYVLFLLVW